MPRVAYLSPLPPARSGIADYSAELLPALAEHLDLELFNLPGLPPPEPSLARRFPVHPLSHLERRAGSYDALLYQMGNHPRYHGPLWRLLPRHPGVVVLHEFVLHHMLREITLVAGDAAGYVEEMRYAYGDTGRSLARRAVDTGVPLDPWTYPLFERAVDAATGVIVHNRVSRCRIRASRPDAPVEVVPHHLSLTFRGEPPDLDSEAGREEARRTARRRLGLPADAFLVGTFGYQNTSKRLDVALTAFASVRQHLWRQEMAANRPEVAAARFLVVGGVDPGVDLKGLFAAGLGEGVEVVGRVEELAVFLDWMTAVDAAINLRYPTGGETSGTVIRLLGLGKPLLVTDAGSFAEIPAGCAVPISTGPAETELLAAYLRALAGDPGLRRDLGSAARRHAVAQHSLEASAAAYAACVARTAAAGRGVAPAAPLPPLAPWRDDDLCTALVADLAAEAHDLGVAAGDDPLLAELAETLVDLGLDRFAPPGRNGGAS